ncbi:Peptidase S8/S53, subtilisin/kexin/sedolisin [Metarhizium brunneum]
MGKSFSHYPNSTEFMNAYFVPSGKHGTQMAKLITQICPDPHLFIAQLEERLAPDGSGRCITAESAAKGRLTESLPGSLATACASGLAGLLLHCERLLGWKVIVNKEKMDNVFKVLAQWGRFPHVRPYFDKHFKKLYGDEIGDKTTLVDIPKLNWDDETRKGLENLMAVLTTHISASQVGG